MSTRTGIEWTDCTWNPVTGCTRVSDGCNSCYAVGMTHRLEAMGQTARYGGLTVKNPKGDRHFNGQVRTHADALMIPLAWKKPRKVFVNSMSDLFHKDVPFEFIDRVFAVMALTTRHTYQILTKRPERMAEYLNHVSRQPHPHAVDQINNCETATCIDVERDCVEIPGQHPGDHWCQSARMADMPWPLPNVWLGTSVEDQAAADKRIPELLKCPANVRFLSCEPLLGPVNLHEIRLPDKYIKGEVTEPKIDCLRRWCDDNYYQIDRIIDWVIVGGESGPGARPLETAWARSIVEQCRAAGVACFVKQLGSQPYASDWEGCSPPMRLKDKKGGDPAEWPEDLRVREFPSASPRLRGPSSSGTEASR